MNTCTKRALSTGRSWSLHRAKKPSCSFQMGWLYLSKDTRHPAQAGLFLPCFAVFAFSSHNQWTHSPMWELPAELQMWLITNLVPSSCLHTHPSCPKINPAKQLLWGTKEWYSINPPGHHSTRDSHFLFQCSKSTDRIHSISLPTHAEKLVENNFLALTASVLSFTSLDQQEDAIWKLRESDHLMLWKMETD